MKAKNSRISKPHVLIFKLTDKLDLRNGEKSIALSNLSISYTWKNKKSSYNNNKFKISAPTWNDEFELQDDSYFISDIQDYFENILKKHNSNIDNPSIRVCVNKIENRITFKIKTGYYLELLTPEATKLLESNENKITMITNKIQEPYIHLLQINHLVFY